VMGFSFADFLRSAYQKARKKSTKRG